MNRVWTNLSGWAANQCIVDIQRMFHCLPVIARLIVYRTSHKDSSTHNQSQSLYSAKKEVDWPQHTDNDFSMRYNPFLLLGLPSKIVHYIMLGRATRLPSLDQSTCIQTSKYQRNNQRHLSTALTQLTTKNCNWKQRCSSYNVRVVKNQCQVNDAPNNSRSSPRTVFLGKLLSFINAGCSLLTSK